MADKIFVADKPTQDLIKAKTDLIGSSDPTVGNRTNLMNYIKLLENLLGVIGTANPTVANTANIMNYVKQLENKLNTMESKIGSIPAQPTPFSNVGALPANYGSGFQTVLTLSGKGFLNSALITTVGNNYNSQIRVTIDGVVKHYSTSSPGVPSGIFQEHAFPSDYTGQISSYPYTAGSLPAVILSSPIYFQSNLKVEVKPPDFTSSVSYKILGGML